MREVRPSGPRDDKSLRFRRVEDRFIRPGLAAHDLGKTVRYVGGIQGVGTVHAGVIDDGLEAVGVGTVRPTILDAFRSAEGSNGRFGSFPRS